jgi:flagellar export protein FliJ
MAKPQKGKFKYRLDPVLRVREIREKQQKQVFAEKERILLEEKDREDKLKTWEDELHQELRGALVGEIADFSSVMRRRWHLVKVKEDVDKQEEKRIAAEKKRDLERTELERKMKERKVIDTDKSNHKEEWVKLMGHEEMKFMDDIASIHFSRKKGTLG